MKGEKNKKIRKQLELLKKQRQTWAINPRTRIIKSNKAYKRNKEKNNWINEDEIGEIWEKNQKL